jgi:hypothetical protein
MNYRLLAFSPDVLRQSEEANELSDSTEQWLVHVNSI